MPQTILARWLRMAALVVLWPLAVLVSLFSRRAALRIPFTVLRGMSRDRCTVLGEEYFDLVLKPHLDPEGTREIRAHIESGTPVALCSGGLSCIVAPLARFLGAEQVLCNQQEYREGAATGRLNHPIVLPRHPLKRWLGRPASRTISLDDICLRLRCGDIEAVFQALRPAQRVFVPPRRAAVVFDRNINLEPLAVRDALRGRHVLIAGVTGFIGKVWLAHVLEDLPEVGRVYVLIRRSRKRSARERFESLMASSPVFARLYERHGDSLPQVLAERVVVLEGDVTEPDLGLDAATVTGLQRDLDLLINSTGLTDFNPDLRSAVVANVDAVLNVLDFVKRCDHACLMHLSTCFVAGQCDGRVHEDFVPNYNPRGRTDFNPERLVQEMHTYCDRVEAQAESPAITESLEQDAIARSMSAEPLSSSALQKQVERNRGRWIRNRLIERGHRYARVYGWPNIYTLTKSVAETLLCERAGKVPLVLVRPAIVETAVRQPFPGWNEGINTSAPLSYLVGTYFRQLPSKRSKCIDYIPVDMVCHGMTLIAAAVLQRRHHLVYQLGTSGPNPCNIQRSLELTCLAYRTQFRDDDAQRRRRLDTIPVSKTRYYAVSAPGQRLLVRILKRIVAATPLNEQLLVKADRALWKTQKLIDLYEPFILHNEQVFEAENIRLLYNLLTEDEKNIFPCDPVALDWWDYMINIHLPGLQRWVFPLIEGRPLDPVPKRPFKLVDPGGPGLNGTDPSGPPTPDDSGTFSEDSAPCPSS